MSNELFDKFDVSLAEARESLRNRNYEAAITVLNDVSNVYDLLRFEINRERKLSRIERDLYSSPRSLGETLDHITHIVKDEFGFSRFDIVIVDHQLERVLHRYSKGGFGEPDLEKLSKHGALNATRDYCLQHMDPWIVNDIKGQDPLWKLALELDCWIHGTFPLYYRKPGNEPELVGFLHGARSKKDFLGGRLLSEREVAELTRISWAVTKAINDAKLSYFEGSVMRIQDIISSTRIEMAHNSHDLNQQKTQTQMDAVLNSMIKSLRADLGGILIKENEKLAPYTFRTRQRENMENENVRLKPLNSVSVLSKTINEGVSQIINEVSCQKEMLGFHIDGYREKIHTLICVPLIESYSEEGEVRKNAIGAILLLNKIDSRNRIIETDFIGNEGGFSTIDRQVLEAVSAHVETIISNTRSHRELKKMSITDGLTGLCNHTHFMNELLAMEFKRSQRYGTPLSILLMDIDHFKAFNDIFGHQVGDLVLKEVATVVTENTRAVDHIVRYGGEEFAVLLHNTNLDDGILYAEKIRNKIAGNNYVGRIRETGLFDVEEACNRFEAILELDDEKIRAAKLEVIRKQFGLDIKKVIDLCRQGNKDEAKEIVLGSFRVTVSIGLAFYPDISISDKKDLLSSADMLLLKAKEKGRNRVEARQV